MTTQIAADGKRYTIGEGPTSAPAVAGKLLTTGAFNARVGIDASRTVTDAVALLDDATVTSTAANFTSADVGATVECAKFSAGTTIASVTSENTVEMSTNAKSAGTGVTLTVERTVQASLNNHETRLAAIPA